MKLFKEVDYENSYSKIDGVKALVAFVEEPWDVAWKYTG